MIVLRIAPGAPIRWRCSVCEDESVVSNWEDSPFDLRRRQPVLAGAVNQIVIPGEVAAALRELRLLDTLQPYSDGRAWQLRPRPDRIAEAVPAPAGH